MKSKYRWFDFADNSFTVQAGPTGGAQTLSLGGSRQPAAASKKNGPTNSEIRNANEEAKGGKKDKCKKGKSCSAACIYHNDFCLVGLPEGLQDDVNRVRDGLTELVKKGTLSEEQASGYFGRLADKKSKSEEEDDEEGGDVTFSKNKVAQMKASYDKLKQQHTVNGKLDEKAFNETLDYHLELAVMASHTDREKAIPASVAEVEGTQKRIAQLEKYDALQKDVQRRLDAGKPYTPEELRQAEAPLIAARRTREEPTLAEKEFFISLLPASEIKYMSTAGALLKSPIGGKYGDDTSTTALPESYGRLDKQTKEQAYNRVLTLAGIYLREDGREFASGIRMPVTWMDLEHNIPAEVAGKAAEQGSNYAFFRTGSNVGRGATPYLQWWAGRVKEGGYEFDKDGNLTPESRNKVQDHFDKKMSQVFFKNDVESRASRAKTGEQIRQLHEQAKEITDKSLREKLLTKIIAFNLNTVETVGGGIQSHGRGDKRWYWFGKDVAGSGELSSRLIDKLTALYEAGDKEKIEKFREILNSGSTRVKQAVEQRVKPDPSDIDEDTGLPFVRVKGARGAEVRAIVSEVRDEVFQEVMAL